MSMDVHIVALAARTPIGLRAEQSVAAARAGISRVMEHPFMVDAQGEPLVCGLDTALPATELGAPRLEALLISVLAEMGDKLTASQPDATIPCLIGLPGHRPGFMKAHAEELNERISEKLQPSFGPQGRLAFQFMAQGHAGAVVGLDRAVSLITSGQSGLCLVGGVESYLEADALAWLDGERRVMRGDIRGGFPPGEGAALFAVASDALRRQLGLPSLATVEAVACANETADEKSAEGLQGVALTEVFRRVGSALKSAGQRFDDVYVDINDERARTTDYAFALLRCGARFRDGSQYETMVGKTGELGAASAAFNCVLAATALASGYSRGQHALVSSASWNGLRGAVLLRKGRG